MTTTRRRILAFLALVSALLVATAVWWWIRPTEATVSVYFIRAVGSSSTVQDEPRTVRGRTAAALLAGAMRELLAEPTPSERGAGLVTAIPAGTRLRGLRIADGVVMVDLSREIESGGGSSSMLGRLWQIVYTATQFPQAPRVRILVDGQAREFMGGEGVVIDRPLARPASPPVF
jgi:spore germination protein GerM